MRFKKTNTTQEPDFRTKEGFERIYNLYAEDLLIVALNQLNNPDEAENLIHDVFSSIWERRDKLQIEGEIENYLFRSVKLAVIKNIRNKSARKKLDTIILRDIPLAENTVEDYVAFNDLSEKISDLVNRLPERTQEIYRLSREEYFTNKEIATRLIISEKTVESHLTKSLKFLRTNLLLILFIILLPAIFFITHINS
ncbi:MAG: RNA polymerase sigma-70 factor [Bacteroidota bacterium]